MVAVKANAGSILLYDDADQMLEFKYVVGRRRRP